MNEYEKKLIEAKGTNATIIYDEYGKSGDPSREIWSGNLNTIQLHEIINWCIEWEYEVFFSPCGGYTKNENLNEIKIQCLKKSIDFFEKGESFIQKEYINLFREELKKLILWEDQQQA